MMSTRFLIIITSLLVSLSLQAQCFQERHSQSIFDSWASCEPAANPNPILPESHWIMYDFAQIYSLGKTHIWNFNYPAQTGIGINEVLISYSINGTDWEQAGQFTIEEASDTGFYEGEEGPDLNGIEARYVLLTALSNHGGDCVGLSEFKVEVLGLVSATDEEILDISLQVSPNPCADFFSFSIDDYKHQKLNYQINNTLGEIVLQAALNGASTIRVDTKQWPDGNYILSINDGNKIKSEKITVVR